MVIIKKVTKLTFYSLIAVGTLFSTLLVKSFWGDSNPNLRQLETKTKNVLLKSVPSDFFISSVRADIPSCASCTCCSSGTGAAAS